MNATTTDQLEQRLIRAEQRLGEQDRRIDALERENGQYLSLIGDSIQIAKTIESDVVKAFTRLKPVVAFAAACKATGFIAEGKDLDMDRFNDAVREAERTLGLPETPAALTEGG